MALLHPAMSPAHPAAVVPARRGEAGRAPRRTPRSRRRLLALLASALPAMGALSCASQGPEGIPASGHIEATEIRVAAKVGGVLAAVLVREGDRVQAGQELARVDSVDIALAAAAARADRDQAAADLRLRLAGAREEEIREAEAQVRRAEAELAGAERDLARMQALLESGSGTAKSRDDALTRRDLAAAGRAAAAEQLRRRRNGSRPEEIEAARARLAAGEARLAQLEQQLRDTRVVSPLDGVVTATAAEAGELIPPGSTICVITDLARPWLTVYVGGPDLDEVRVGGEAVVRTDGGAERTGRVTFVADRAEFTPKNVQTREERERLVYRVKIGLENADGLFKPGMPAEAVLRTDRGRS